MRNLDGFRATHLVGRENELALLRRALADARTYRGRAVIIAGALGTGKTRLGLELLHLAQAEGALCISGAAFAVETDLPYGVFLTALEPLLRQDATGRMVLRRVTSAFAGLAPSLDADRAGAGVPEEMALIGPRLCDSVAQLLRESRSQQPLVLFLDDLHWADRQSLSLLHFLVRRVETCRALILVSYRPEYGATNPALREVLTSLSRLGCLDHLTLDALSREQTQALIKHLLHYEDDISPAFLDQLYAHTEGNPLFIEETLRALAAQGDIYLQEGRWLRRPIQDLQVPQTLRDALLLRIADLSPASLHLIETAAAIGFEADHGLLRRVCGLDEDQFDEALSDLCRRDLLVETSGLPSRYRFRHPILHGAVYGATTAATRRRYHRRIAAALEDAAVEGGAPSWSLLAWHAACGDGISVRPGCVDRLLDAADEAWNGGDVLEASRIYEIVLPVSSDSDHASRTLRWLRLGEARAWSGNTAGAFEAWRVALAAAPVEPALIRVRIGELHWAAGEESAAEGHLRRSLAGTADSTGLASGLSLASMASVLCDRGNWSEAEALCSEAHAAAEIAGQHTVIAAAQAVLLSVHGFRGEPAMAERCVEQALAAASAAGSRPLLWEVHLRAAECADLCGATRRALAHLESCFSLADALRSPVFRAHADAQLGIVLTHQGAWTEALAAFGRATDAQRELDLWGALPRTLAGAADVQRRRGKTAVARAHLNEAQAIIHARGLRRRSAVLPVWLGHAWLSLDAGQPRRASYEAAQAAAALGHDRSSIPGNELLALLAAIAVAEGTLETAAQLTDAAQGSAERAGHVPGIARAWDIRGCLLRARGEVAGAEDAIRRAADLWAALERPFEEGASRVTLAQLTRGHDSRRVPADLARAHALLHPLGAEPALKLVRRELAGLGGDLPRRRTPQHTNELTERERELTVLLARRCGTEEIADRLVISPATVRTHIRNIFRKLSVSSRGELALVAREHGFLS
jgi:DNA-binding CsgD family transcriptional regulator/tetratricopeptide (TPR) repeat protein